MEGSWAEMIRVFWKLARGGDGIVMGQGARLSTGSGSRLFSHVVVNEFASQSVIKRGKKAVSNEVCAFTTDLISAVLLCRVKGSLLSEILLANFRS